MGNDQEFNPTFTTQYFTKSEFLYMLPMQTDF